jgi:hypothetical protein
MFRTRTEKGTDMDWRPCALTVYFEYQCVRASVSTRIECCGRYVLRVQRDHLTVYCGYPLVMVANGESGYMLCVLRVYKAYIDSSIFRVYQHSVAIL